MHGPTSQACPASGFSAIQFLAIALKLHTHDLGMDQKSNGINA